jgi:methylthioribulose-1-phosphate dehydratase
MTPSSREPSPERLRQAGVALAAEAARFASFGWMRGTSGNLSIVMSRDPLRLAVTASGLDKGSLSPTDVVIVDAAGRQVATGADPAPRPSAESALHARVVALTGAGAVVHVHTVAAVVAGRRWPGGVELSDFEMLKGIGVAAAGERVSLPVIANSQDRHPKVPAVIVADHGLYAWGGDLIQARHHTEVVEWLLEVSVTLS